MNLVDERSELTALIFRLAGRQEYGDLMTDYQNELAETFVPFKDHPAVTFAAGLPLGYDAVFNFAAHMEKSGDGFKLQEISVFKINHYCTSFCCLKRQSHRHRREPAEFPLYAHARFYLYRPNGCMDNARYHDKNNG